MNQEGDKKMCRKCKEAAAVLAKILPDVDDPNKLKQWAMEQKSTEITRMVAAYLTLTQPLDMDMLNTERLPLEILGDIRENKGADNENDASVDDLINRMSNNELLHSFLEWNGLIFYDYKIKNAIEKIFGVDLE